MNDEIVCDLASLRTAHARNLIYQKLVIPYPLRSKYSLKKIADYILVDQRMQILSDIFEEFSLLR
jgi:hypothetical protein